MKRPKYANLGAVSRKEAKGMDTDLTLTAPVVTTSPSTVVWVDPKTLLHPERLDIAAKAFYANTLLGRPTHCSLVDAELCYLKHIQFRTGGQEPGDALRKGSLESFKLQFIELIDAMRRDGFREEFAIPVAKKTGLILNGAHRLAAALCLGIKRVPVVYNTELEGLTWNTRWFMMQGFTPLEIDALTRTWVALKQEQAGCIILWPTLQPYWPAIEKSIQAKTPIVYQRTISLDTKTFPELVRDIYATDWGPVPGENIENKIQLFSRYPTQLKFLVVGQNKVGDLKNLKQEIRDAWHHIIPSDKFASLHTTDSVRETAYIADVFLNRANLAALKYRAQGIRPEFLNWLSSYFQKLNELQIDAEKCCIVGSGVLEAHGIRHATDVDFTVTHDIRERLFTPGVTHLTENLDVVAKDYPRAEVGCVNAPNDNQLITDTALHIRFRGLKVAALNVVLTRKQTQRRFKDLMDIALVAQKAFEET